MDRKKRKLVRHKLLLELAEKSSMGVPLTRLIRDAELDISRPHLYKLLYYYNTNKRKRVVYKSLFPPWLDTRSDIQLQPKNYKYKGLFPWGEWIEI